MSDDKTSHASTANINNMLEYRYQIVTPPCLTSVAPKDIHEFIKSYEKYKKLRLKDQLSVIEWRDCVDDDLKERMQLLNPSALETEDNFAAFLKGEETIDEAEDLTSELADLEMDMSIKSVENRLAHYDMRFLAIRKRAAGLQHLRERVLVEAYVKGMRPKMVKQSLQALIKCQDLPLVDVMKAAEQKAKANEDLYRQVSKSNEEDDKASKDNAYKDRGHRPQVHSAPISQPSSSTAAAGESKYNLRPSTRKCYRCGAPYTPGHNAVCPKKSKQIHAVSNDNAAGSQAKDVSAITLRATIGDLHIDAEVDTGASSSCITMSLARKLEDHVAVTYRPIPTTMKNVNQVTTKSRIVCFELILQSNTGFAKGVTTPWQFMEIAGTEKGPDILLLGRDILGELGYIQEGVLHIEYDKVPSNKELIEADADDDLDDKVLEMYYAIEEKKVPQQRQIDLVRIEMPEVKERGRTMLEKYEEVFSEDLPPEGAEFPPYKFEITVDEVIHEAVRPMRPDIREKAHHEYEKMRAQGRARDSKGPFQSPAVPVKKGEKLRMCGDYRKLNAITKPHIYPLPDIRHMLQAASGKKVFGKLDARKSFNQMPVYAPHIPMTAVRTPDDYVEFPFVPFGVRNAAMVFQEQMELLFYDLLYTKLAIFVDDIIIYADTVDEFLSTVEEVLSRCKKVRLRLGAEKCIIAAEIIEAVGHVLSCKGRSISKERVAAIQDLAKPTDESSLRSFLGAVGYFRDFVPKFADIATPLTTLMDKAVQWKWGQDEQLSYETLKNAITSDTVLAHGTEQGTLVMRTDASGVGIGGVLLLRTAQGDRPITYFSKKLSKTQMRWSTIEQELYAIVYGVSLTPYAPLLMLKPFVVETDHRNLIYLDKMSATNSKLMRWRLHLSQFDFEIRHISGVDNRVADALSRLPSTKECLEIFHVDVSQSITQRLQASQEKYLQEEEKRKLTFTKSKLWCNTQQQAVVPQEDKQLQLELLCGTHGTTMIGHVGPEKTAAAIQQAGYTWKTIISDATAFVQSCGVCQKMNRRIMSATIAKMYDTAAYWPWLVVAMDTVGPLKEDKWGYKYILVFIDAFTRWVELVATKCADAQSCADALIERIFMRYGLPKEIRSDNGSQFVNEVITDMLEKLKVRHHRVLPYHPQSNGIVERVNQEVTRHLRCLTVDFDSKNEWSKLLPLVQHILNHTVSSGTGETPYAMLHGRESEYLHDPLSHLATDPTSIVMKFPELDENSCKTYVDELSRQLRHIHDAARILQSKNVEARKARANDKEPTSFAVGEYVLCLPIEKTGKLAARREGPLKVIWCDDATNSYKLQSLVDPNRVLLVHKERMCKFATREDINSEELKKLAALDEEEYMVETVLGHRGASINDIEFKLKWSGYEETTWEPWVNVEGCIKLDEYLKDHADAATIVYPPAQSSKKAVKSSKKNGRM